MMNRYPHRGARLSALPLLIAICWLSCPQASFATDYFLTIGGGYEPAGNQASLEENVVFFQQVLKEKHSIPYFHDIFFADGNDPEVDLQILADKPARSQTPATDLLAILHRQEVDTEVTYRNHRVPGIAGPLDPKLIRGMLERLTKMVKGGDRLIVYVTAHGSEGPKEDQFNTTIDCWNEQQITAREFSGWLDKLPADVPVVMVMAQCYCGGFSRTMFVNLDEKKGLAPQLRAGFFAQQHDLPAAGCRPDIEHDEEFSSYFWGAIVGRSRNGVPIQGVDLDKNGVVSFAEAYAYAVVAGETIDIPLRTSEVLLRTYSRLGSPLPKATPMTAEPQPGTPAPDHATKQTPALATMSGSLQSFVDRGRPVSGRIVMQLSATLGFQLENDVTAVTTAYNEHRRAGRAQGRGRGRRQGGGRRDFLREVAMKWPELADEEAWEESPLLNLENQAKLLAELQQLPGWKAYDARVKQRAVDDKQAEQHELRAVKFRRLINALECIVLEQNLPHSGPPEAIARYQQILTVEESTIDSNAARK